MSISTKAVCDKITSLIASKTLNAAEAAALSVSCNLDVQTSTWTGLPAAASNEGRFYYVTDCCGYHYSDGTTWNNSVDVTAAVNAKIIYGIGLNDWGQLGDNTTINKSSPVLIVGGFTDWCDVGAGNAFSAGIKSNGTIWTWGAGFNGSLGDNTVTSKSSPVQIVGGLIWNKMSVGRNHTVALKNDNTAWAWGYNGYGRLGDNTTVNKSSPVPVVGGFTWCKLSTASSSSIGIKTDGTMWAWGSNICGVLGDGTTVNKSSPVAVVGGFADWCNIGLGNYSLSGIRTNGSLWFWGRNVNGQLGDGTTVDKSSPVSVIGGFTDWTQAVTSIGSSIALRTNGTAWAWGCNGWGQLGNGTAINISSPVSVIGGFTDWCEVSTNVRTSAGLRMNGTAWTWGSNVYGQLGDGTTIDKSSPVSVVGGFKDWQTIAKGVDTTLLVRFGA